MGATYLMWQLWGSYRDVHRRSNANRAIAVAAEMRAPVADRLGKGLKGALVTQGLKVARKAPVTQGYIGNDGSIVVEAELDYFVPLTVMLRPVSAPSGITWSCGVATAEQTRYVSSACQNVVKVPSAP